MNDEYLAIAKHYYRKRRRAEGYAYKALYDRLMWWSLMLAAGVPADPRK